MASSIHPDALCRSTSVVLIVALPCTVDLPGDDDERWHDLLFSSPLRDFPGR